MDRAEYYELDICKISQEIADEIPGVTKVALFGSRKFQGKVCSDLDLLVYGAPDAPSLTDFRSKFPHYGPLDLWLVMGDQAISAVNGSVLTVQDLQTVELFPNASPDFTLELRRQRFRTDINYAMTIIPPASFALLRGDYLGITSRLPKLHENSLSDAADTVVQILHNCLQAIQRMRSDGNAGRGKGTVLTFSTEYDIQNLAELLLAPVFPIQREPFIVRCEGVRRTADFSLAEGRLVLELKMPKTSGELANGVKQAKGVLNCYLDHPGV
jgi:hypothetical protein